MGFFEHNPRARIFNPAQHPLVHSASEFSYLNDLMPAGSTLSEAVDYLFAVIYPKYIGRYANVAALPVLATQNDYAVVSDDGDGKSAGYVWFVIEGVAGWQKRYDVDWSVESILSETVNRTLYMYVHKYGLTDKDGAGAAIVGLYAGQKIYGGDATNQNLTFNANAFDGTGFVQTDNIFRATSDNALDLGTAALKWRTLYAGTSAIVGTLTVAPALITDTSGAISFDNEDLTTTGFLHCAALVASGTATINADLLLAAGSITSTSGAISFGNENLSTTGTLASGTITVSADLILATGSITSASGAISFGNENLSTTGTLSAGDVTATRVDSDNLRLDGNTLSVLNAGGNLIIQANGAGVVDIQSAMTTIGQTVTGVLAVTGQLNADNLRLDGNVLSSTNANGNITLTPNGSGKVEASATLFPTTSASQDLGDTTHLWRTLYLGTSISNATTAITMADLLTLRDAPFRDTARTLPAQAGDTLFWDAVNSVWLANHPDTEITHSELTGLTTGDSGHTQFVMLAGRAGGQTIQGDTGASGNLSLESTSNGTKGKVLTKDTFAAFTDASFAVTWSGSDLGGTTNYFRDLYTRGELRGARLENFTFAGLPAASAAAKGRSTWATDQNKIYTDVGGSWLNTSVARFISDTSWNGSDLTKTVTVSSTITDARNCIIQLLDNANDFERITAVIKAISATQVTITTNVALAAGSYRLVVVE